MRVWSRFYFYQLFRFNKWLAFGVFIFFVLNIVFNVIKPTQQTPIYNWNLYAYPLPVLDTFSFIAVEYNDGKVLRFKRTWQEPQKVLLGNTMNLFVANYIDGNLDYSQVHFKNNWLPQNKLFTTYFPSFTNFPNKREMKHFPQWYRTYLQQYTNQTIDSIKFLRKVVVLNNEGDIKEISSEQIYTIK